MSSLLDALLGTNATIVSESSSPASPPSPDLGVAGDAGDAISGKVLSARCESPSRSSYTDPTAADAALALLNRLRCYSVPAGRMAVICELAERLKAVEHADAEAMLHALEAFEAEVIALGGAPDPELGEAVAMVEGTFRSAWLVEVRRRRLN